MINFKKNYKNGKTKGKLVDKKIVQNQFYKSYLPINIFLKTI